ncbi:MAG: hypothetical protein GEU73_17865 [Chloroflexi bacterium]|nr:hypothetical protein [Chloroflexota bacterium]
MKGWRGLCTAVGVALVVAAVAQELSRPAGQRTWHGRIAGCIPYDFRPPTLERITASFWDPGSDRLFIDRCWGIGWGVNLAAIARRLGLQ